MAVGAIDRIDKMLVKKYAQEKVDNHDNINSAVSPDVILTAMNNSAAMTRNFLYLNNKLKKVCHKVNSNNLLNTYASYQKVLV